MLSLIASESRRELTMPFTDVGVTRVHWQDAGSGPALVLLHGLGGDIDFWDVEREALSAEFRLILVDLRGSGRTAASPGGHRVEDLADDVFAVLDHADVPRAHVLGFSMGGLVAQAMAYRQPARVDRVVLASTYARMGTQSRMFLDAVLTTYQQSRSAGQLFDLIAPWLFSPEFVDDPANQSLLTFTDDGDQTLDDWRQLYLAQRAFDATGVLNEIVAPTLVIAGAQDALVPTADAAALAQAIAGARLRMIPGAGHLITVEARQEFLQAVRGFLRPG
jgi:3-oxoadipate enol-lactonase